MTVEFKRVDDTRLSTALFVFSNIRPGFFRGSIELDGTGIWQSAPPGLQSIPSESLKDKDITQLIPYNIHAVFRETPRIGVFSKALTDALNERKGTLSTDLKNSLLPSEKTKAKDSEYRGFEKSIDAYITLFEDYESSCADDKLPTSTTSFYRCQKKCSDLVVKYKFESKAIEYAESLGLEIPLPPKTRPVKK